MGASTPSKSKSSAVSSGARPMWARSSSGVTARTYGGVDRSIDSPPGRTARHTPAVSVRRRSLAFATALVMGAVAACGDDTVAIRFDPEVGDEYRFRSEIASTVERTIDGETTTETDDAVLRASEVVTDVGDEEVTLEVTLERDGADVRTYEARYDRGDRLSTIDLVEGVPAATVGLALDTDLPSDIASPPDGPLFPGAKWNIERPLGDLTITGHGAVVELGVEDGREFAVVEIELTVPVESEIETTDGVVTVSGSQSSRSRATYDLGDGAVRRDETDIEGLVDIVVEPPSGVDASPVTGTIDFEISVRTRRVPG